MNRITENLIEKYINKLDIVDFDYWIEEYGIDVYTFLTCNIVYDINEKQLISEAHKYFINAEELRLLYRKEVIILFNRMKNNLLLNRLDELMNV